MHVGVARLWLRMPENGSLKDKRQVVRSLLQRLRNQFGVAAADVGPLDDWQTACLGISTVSNDAAVAHQLLSRAVGFVRETRLDAELFEEEIEVAAF